MDFVDHVIVRSAYRLLRALTCDCSLSLCISFVVLLGNVMFMYVQYANYRVETSTISDKPILEQQNCYLDGDEMVCDNDQYWNEKIDYYAEAEYSIDEIQEDMKASDLLLEIQSARENLLYKEFIGKATQLSTGLFLLHNRHEDAEDIDSVLLDSLVILTSHGGAERSHGYVLNHKLNEEESLIARDMLHRAGSEDGELSNALIRSYIDTNVWLGVGGPERHEDEIWMHIHRCTDYEGVDIVIQGLGMGGDILELLVNESCAPIKLLYGSLSWGPGQLDEEVINGHWHVLSKGSPRIVPVAMSTRLTKREVWTMAANLVDSKGQ